MKAKIRVIKLPPESSREVDDAFDLLCEPVVRLLQSGFEAGKQAHEIRRIRTEVILGVQWTARRALWTRRLRVSAAQRPSTSRRAGTATGSCR